jgi:kynurenine formamidase
MILRTILDKQEFVFDTSRVLDISIPLNFNGDQPNSYEVEHASSKAYETVDFIGDTRRGGGCNFEQLIITPHCNGTHTECLGHITHERYSVHKQLKDSIIPATLISVVPERAIGSGDNYKPAKNKEDVFISKHVLQKALLSVPEGFLKALVIRTLPNDDSKKTRNYMDFEPPFISLEAMNFIVEAGVEHLLIDTPSVDRLFDDGNLNAHHIFWNVEEGSHESLTKQGMHKTITEMIYVSDEIKDGSYLLNLQIAPFVSDASPSRPLLYPLTEIVDQ